MYLSLRHGTYFSHTKHYESECTLIIYKSTFIFKCLLKKIENGGIFIMAKKYNCEKNGIKYFRKSKVIGHDSQRESNHKRILWRWRKRCYKTN